MGTVIDKNFTLLHNLLYSGSSKEDVKMLYTYACVVQELIYRSEMPSLDFFYDDKQNNNEQSGFHLLTWRDKMNLIQVAAASSGTAFFTFAPLETQLGWVKSAAYAAIDKEHEADAFWNVAAHLKEASERASVDG